MPAFAPAEKPFARGWPVLKAPAAARGAAATLAGLLALAALLVAERRLAGALVVPLGAIALTLTAAAAALIAAAARIAWLSAWRLGGEAQSGQDRLACPAWLAPSSTTNAAIRWLPAAALVVLGLSLWLPGTGLTAVACFWSVAIVEEAWSLLPRQRGGAAENGSPASRLAEKLELHLKPAAPLEFSAVAKGAELADAEEIDDDVLEEEAESREPPQSPSSGHGKLAGPHYDPPRPASTDNLCDPPHHEPAAPHFGLTSKTGETSPPADERIVQQLKRSTTREGVDMLRGSLCATFPPGLRTLSIHVAFCPAFAERPRMEFRQTSGPAARIKLGQLLAFGARFDIKLAVSAEIDETVVLEISAAHP